MTLSESWRATVVYRLVASEWRASIWTGLEPIGQTQSQWLYRLLLGRILRCVMRYRGSAAR